MNAHLLRCSLLISLAAGVLAQTPAAPVGETAATFTAPEAQAFAMAMQLADSWRAGETPKATRENGRVDGYRLLTARREGDGTLQFLGEGSDPARAFAAGDAVCYFVPEAPGASARRVFCVRGDGVVAVTDNTAGTAMRDGRAPGADDVLGDGGKGTLRDFPRTPARGRDGNFWLPADMVKKATLRLVVVDEAGEPLAGIGIATVVAGQGNEVDALLPAGSTRSLLEGDAVLQGVPARGLGFVVTSQGVTMPLGKAAVRIEGTSARLVVARTLLQQVVWKRNESAAIATLKNISSAQAQCQACAIIDANGNGSGEYGTFAELTGRDVVRGGKVAMNPPVLSTAFRKVEDGVVTRNGYCFRIFLPGQQGVPVAELAKGGPDAAAIDAGQAETLWCVYAWPSEAGVSGQRAFFIDQNGDVLACPNAESRYSGAAKSPKADAARTAGSTGAMNATMAANAVGVDGHTWVVIG